MELYFGHRSINGGDPNPITMMRAMVQEKWCRLLRWWWVVDKCISLLLSVLFAVGHFAGKWFNNWSCWNSCDDCWFCSGTNSKLLSHFRNQYSFYRIYSRYYGDRYSLYHSNSTHRSLFIFHLSSECIGKCFQNAQVKVTAFTVDTPCVQVVIISIMMVTVMETSIIFKLPGVSLL